jgi:hypothetical protein
MEAARHDSQVELTELRALVAEQAHELTALQAARNAEVEKRDAIIASMAPRRRRSTARSSSTS